MEGFSQGTEKTDCIDAGFYRTSYGSTSNLGKKDNKLSKMFTGLFSSFAHRERTFDIWPRSHNGPKPSELAMSGFYYTGHGDITECFKCKTKVSQWDSDDSAINEHKRWSPNCEYLRYLIDD